MYDREEDVHKVWLENLTEAEYEANKAARKRQRDEGAQRLLDRS